MPQAATAWHFSPGRQRGDPGRSQRGRATAWSCPISGPPAPRGTMRNGGQEILRSFRNCQTAGAEGLVLRCCQTHCGAGARLLIFCRAPHLAAPKRDPWGPPRSPSVSLPAPEAAGRANTAASPRGWPVHAQHTVRRGPPERTPCVDRQGAAQCPGIAQRRGRRRRLRLPHAQDILGGDPRRGDRTPPLPCPRFRRRPADRPAARTGRGRGQPGPGAPLPPRGHGGRPALRSSSRAGRARRGPGAAVPARRACVRQGRPVAGCRRSPQQSHGRCPRQPQGAGCSRAGRSGATLGRRGGEPGVRPAVRGRRPARRGPGSGTVRSGGRIGRDGAARLRAQLAGAHRVGDVRRTPHARGGLRISSRQPGPGTAKVRSTPA